MPLVVLAGQPASGKSTAAARLRELLQGHGPVELVDEPSLHLQRNAAYASGCRAAAAAEGTRPSSWAARWQRQKAPAARATRPTRGCCCGRGVLRMLRSTVCSCCLQSTESLPAVDRGCHLLTAGSTAEKMARATLKSAMERVLTKQSTVILDSLNNIKVGGGDRQSTGAAALGTAPSAHASGDAVAAAAPCCCHCSVEPYHRNTPAPCVRTPSPQGYRYEVWCVARTVGTRYCVVSGRRRQHRLGGWAGGAAKQRLGHERCAAPFRLES